MKALEVVKEMLFPGVLSELKRQSVDDTIFTLICDWGNKWFNVKPSVKTTYNNRLFGSLTIDNINKRHHLFGGVVSASDEPTALIFELLTDTKLDLSEGFNNQIITVCSNKVLDEFFSNLNKKLALKSSTSGDVEQWVVRAEIQLKDRSFDIFLGADMFRSDRQSDNRICEKINSIDSLLHNEAIEFEAKIKNIQLDGHQLTSLKVGQVIDLKHPLSKPLTLVKKDMDEELEGFLVNKNNKKSIYLVGKGND